MSLIRQMLAPRASFVADLTNPNAFLGNAGYGRKTTSGETVNPATALTLSAWFACIRDISEDVSMLPLNLFEKKPNGGRARADDHKVNQLLDQPNPENTSMTVRETMNGWTMGWGNGYAEIERDGAGDPIALWPIHPARVRVLRIDGIVVYDVYSPEYKPGAVIRLAARDIIHVRGFGDDMLCGLSVARMAAESLGLSLAAQTFGAAFFGNGAQLGLILEHPGLVGPQAQVRLRESWAKIHSGAENAHKIAILEEGMKASKISVPPEEAQFIETREHQDAEIARWFRMPVHKIQQMKAATFGNIEHQSIEYVNDCLMPWCRRWELELERKLLDPRDRGKYVILHDVTTRMRGDSNARANFYRGMISTGVMTPNEARAMEALNPAPADVGDQLYMQGAMSTLERIVEGPPPPVAPTPGAPPGGEGDDQVDGKDDPKDDQPPADKEDPKQQAELLRPVFADAEARCRRKEDLALANAIRKHTKRESFNAWATEFYTEHGGYIVAALEPGLLAFENATRSLRTGRLDTTAIVQAARDYSMNAMRHVIARGTNFIPDQPFADTVIALLTMETSNV